MQIRMIHPRPGAGCWLRSDGMHPLPAGLTKRTPLEVIRPQPHTVIVRDTAGHQWELPLSQVDCGAQYSFQAGEWLPESDPRILAELRSALRNHLAANFAGFLPRATGDVVRDTCSILERNGQDVSEFLPYTERPAGARSQEKRAPDPYAYSAS